MKAMQDASLAHFGGFAHSLQLVWLLSQRAIADITVICRSIVGHFHRLAHHTITLITNHNTAPHWVVRHQAWATVNDFNTQKHTNRFTLHKATITAHRFCTCCGVN